MIVYRLSKEKHVSECLTGKGAEKAGGRWNKKGIPAVYTAGSTSLAILETIVHCQFISELYNRFVLTIEVPDDSIDELDQSKFPPDWNRTPCPVYTVNEGTKWIQSKVSLILKLPSAIVKSESIFLINPAHNDHSRIKMLQKEIFSPDHRLILLPAS